MNEPRQSPTWNVVVADQARMLELRSQPEDPPTEWLVAVTQRKKIAVINITIIILTAQPGLGASISVQISTYTEDPQRQSYKGSIGSKENIKIDRKIKETTRNRYELARIEESSGAINLNHTRNCFLCASSAAPSTGRRFFKSEEGAARRGGQSEREEKRRDSEQFQFHVLHTPLSRLL